MAIGQSCKDLQEFCMFLCPYAEPHTHLSFQSPSSLLSCIAIKYSVCVGDWVSEEENRSVFWDMALLHRLEEYLSLCLWVCGFEFRGLSLEYYTVTNQKTKTFCQESMLEYMIRSSWFILKRPKARTGLLWGAWVGCDQRLSDFWKV